MSAVLIVLMRVLRLQSRCKLGRARLTMCRMCAVSVIMVMIVMTVMMVMIVMIVMIVMSMIGLRLALGRMRGIVLYGCC